MKEEEKINQIECMIETNPGTEGDKEKKGLEQNNERKQIMTEIVFIFNLHDDLQNNSFFDVHKHIDDIGSSNIGSI